MNIAVRFLLVPMLLLVCSSVFAQPSLEKLGRKLGNEKKNSAQSFYKFELNRDMPTQAGLLFSPDMAVQKTNFQGWLRDKLGLRSGMDSFQQKAAPTTYAGTEISKLQQFYKGIKVEHGIISQVAIENSVRLLQLEFYPIPQNMPTAPRLSEDAALQKAMKFVGAQQYAWQNNPTNAPENSKPRGELVIVEDMYTSVKASMCLTYKFEIFAVHPASSQFVYVDAITGKVVFSDIIIKHFNQDRHEVPLVGSGAGKSKGESHFKMESNLSPRVINAPQVGTVDPTYELGTGFLKYSGTKNFVTEKVTPTQFRLRGSRGIDFDNLVEYKTSNANGLAFPALTLGALTDYTDNNNTWDEADYISNGTYAALDAHWNVEKIIDYWADKHNRKSYDNNNGSISTVCNYGNNFANAFWASQSKTLFCGNGGIDNGNTITAVTSLDVIAHELGHAICDFTAALVYKRESGALNEGFSDIWAACIENHVNTQDTALNKQPFLIGDEIMEIPEVQNCLRDMTAPTNQGQPDTYLDKNGFWFDANVENCPVPINSDDLVFGNDFCGVHRNSGVLNKWFYLITHGEVDFTNGYGQRFTVDSMGFDKTEKIAFYTEMILTPNSGFEAARIASVNAIMMLASFPNAQGIFATDTTNILKAWKAVGVVTDSIYDEINTPLFDTSFFTSIAVGKYGYIWAGTSNRGLYKYNGREWQKAPVLLNHNIADIKADKDGGIWIAQFGRTGAQAINGGISYFPDTSFKFKQFSTSEGVPTRNVRSLFIDNYLPINTNAITDTFKRVWAACFSDLTGSVTRNGNAVIGLPSPVTDTLKYFKKILNVERQVITYCQTIAGSPNEVWVYVSMSSPDTNKIIRYRRSDTSYLGAFDLTNSPFPQNFNAKAMYHDTVSKKWWVGMASGGVYVYDTQVPGWTQINFPAIFPPGTIVNNNAITGDTRGNIYIGTTNGLVYFGSANSSVQLIPTNELLYKRYTTADGLPSNSVRGIAIDYRASRVLLATENGIAFRYILCKECVNNGPIYSVMPGDWSNPGIWSGGEVPGLTSNVLVKHPIVVSGNANCNSLKVVTPGNLTINAGVKLNVEAANYNSNFNPN